MSLTPDIAVNHKYIMIAYAFLAIFWSFAVLKLFQRKIGGKIVAVLANGLERDITALVEYRDDGSGGVEAVYTYGTSVQPFSPHGRTSPAR